MDLSRLKELLAGEPKFRYKQIYDAVYRRYISSWEEAGDIPKELRVKLAEYCPLDISADISPSQNKRTVKAGIYFEGGLVETVLMRYPDGRNTVCVSSQIGCSLGCKFCATGQLGLCGNLLYTEIVQQVLLFERYLKQEEQRVTNVVFMGMGEPLLNYNQVMRAIHFLNDKDFFNIGVRRISVSTVGIVDSIKKLIKEGPRINLAISLNAASDSLRSSLMPVNKKRGISEVLDVAAEHARVSGREVMIEYIMLAEVNDSVSQARKLAELLKNKLGRSFVVNLIEFNPARGYRGSSPEQIGKFKKVLQEHGVKVVQRYKFGRDIKAACGQLAGERE